MKTEKEINASGITFIKDLGFFGKNKRFLCKCHCGKDFVMTASGYYSLRIKSCGCLKKKIAKNNPRLYSIWMNMKVRCRETNPNIKPYEYYSGKGIKVCKQWEGFEEFYKWAMGNGYKNNLTIDRIDNSKGYEPSNCRWSDVYEQAGNKTNNLYITIDGQKTCARAWCRENGVGYKALMSRHYRNVGTPMNELAIWYLNREVNR